MRKDGWSDFTSGEKFEGKKGQVQQLAMKKNNKVLKDLASKLNQTLDKVHVGQANKDINVKNVEKRHMRL